MSNKYELEMKLEQARGIAEYLEGDVEDFVASHDLNKYDRIIRMVILQASLLKEAAEALENLCREYKIVA